MELGRDRENKTMTTPDIGTGAGRPTIDNIRSIDRGELGEGTGTEVGRRNKDRDRGREKEQGQVQGQR